MLLLTSLFFVLVACANPLNQATFHRYNQQAIEAEGHGDWQTAEMAYYRAAENARWGNLGDKYESESLYNLGRVKRIVGKLDESEELLTRALAIDERLNIADGLFASYTMAELALTYYDNKKYEEGIALLAKIEPTFLKYNEKYSDQGREFISNIFKIYAEELSRQGKLKEAEKLEKITASN